MSLNVITIQGRLCADPDLRSTQAGKKVASFTLAVDRDFQKDEADFIACVAWEKKAEFVDQYFTKGQMALVTGRLQIRQWTDKEGGKRTAAEVVANEIHFCGPKQTQQGYARTGAPEYTEIEDEDDLELPF